MDSQKGKIISDEEMEILQETMNISFGKAASDLADVIDTRVVLSVPYIKVLRVTELLEYIKNEVKDYSYVSIVEQRFWGRFKGDALLIFPAGAGRELVTMIKQEAENITYESDSLDILQMEALMEVGNILIGACVGKLAELLKDTVTYTHPRVIIERYPQDVIPEMQYDTDSTAIVLRTIFRFEEGNVSGFLFLITRNESIDWLRRALHEFIAQYE
jgi:chemotaxis protein CheC